MLTKVLFSVYLKVTWGHGATVKFLKADVSLYVEIYSIES